MLSGSSRSITLHPLTLLIDHSVKLISCFLQRPEHNNTSTTSHTPALLQLRPSISWIFMIRQFINEYCNINVFYSCVKLVNLVSWWRAFRQRWFNRVSRLNFERLSDDVSELLNQSFDSLTLTNESDDKTISSVILFLNIFRSVLLFLTVNCYLWRI